MLTGWCGGQVGPELEIPGYGCEDHFLEQDTIEHSWECVGVRSCKESPEEVPKALKPYSPRTATVELFRV